MRKIDKEELKVALKQIGVSILFNTVIFVLNDGFIPSAIKAGILLGIVMGIFISGLLMIYSIICEENKKLKNTNIIKCILGIIGGAIGGGIIFTLYIGSWATGEGMWIGMRFGLIITVIILLIEYKKNKNKFTDEYLEEYYQKRKLEEEKCQKEENE